MQKKRAQEVQQRRMGLKCHVRVLSFCLLQAELQARVKGMLHAVLFSSDNAERDTFAIFA